MRLHSILVPLDGSAFAEAALPAAQEVARRVGARLRLVLVFEAHWFTAAGDRGAALAVAARERARAYLESVATSIGESSGLPAQAALLEGVPGPALAAEAVAHADSLVVMTTHGRGALSRMWLGSVADYLVRHLDIPILLVRPQDSGPSSAPEWQRVLVALDGSAESERILDALAAIAPPATPLTLVTVVPPVLGVAQPAVPLPVPVDPDLLQEAEHAARARLEQVAARAAPAGWPVDTVVLSGTSPARALLDEAGSGRYTLIALTTRGAGGLRRALVGSVADKVIRGANLPVLVWSP